MQIINRFSKQIIDVPYEHAEMLFKQGWEEYKEEKPVPEKTIRKPERKTK